MLTIDDGLDQPHESVAETFKLAIQRSAKPALPMTLGNVAAAGVRLIVWVQRVRAPSRARHG